MRRSRELLLKVGLFGLQDLRRLAPIGDIGYLNAITLMKAFYEQQKKYGWTVEGGDTGWRCTDHWAYCPEIGLRWSVDSGD